VNVGVEDLIGNDVVVDSSVAVGCTWEHDVMTREAKKIECKKTEAFFIFVLSSERQIIEFYFPNRL
jgi:hypothetical protein